MCLPVNHEVGGSNPPAPVLPNERPRNHSERGRFVIQLTRGAELPGSPRRRGD